MSEANQPRQHGKAAAGNPDGASPCGADGPEIGYGAGWKACGRVLGMIEGFLKAGVMEGMESWEPEAGTPQGGVISPLLANIYLDPLDWLMERNGLEMVRYADDMIVLCRDGEKARGQRTRTRQRPSPMGKSIL